MSCQQQIRESNKNLKSDYQVTTIQFPSQIEGPDQIQKSIIEILAINQSQKSNKQQNKYSLLLHCKDQPKILDFLITVAIHKSIDIKFKLFCERLTILNLNVNNITSIQKMEFLPLKNLNQIHLSMNKIHSLNIFCKLNFKHLVYLNVCQNRLKSIGQLFKSDLCNLEMFWTYDNILQCQQQIFKMNSPKLNGFEISNLQNTEFFVFPFYKKFAKVSQSFGKQQLQDQYNEDNEYQQCGFD